MAQKSTKLQWPPYRVVATLATILFIIFATMQVSSLYPTYFVFRMNTYVLLSVFGVLLNSVLLAALYVRKGHFNARLWLSVSIIGIILLGIGQGLERLATTPEQALFWSRLGLVGIPLISTGFYMFAYFYTNKKHNQRDALLPALLLAGGVVLVTFVLKDFTTELIIKSRGPWGYDQPLSTTFVLLTLWLGVIVLLGILKFVIFYYASITKEERQQSKIIIVCAGTALAGALIVDVLPRYLGINILPLALLFQSVLPLGVIYAIYRYDTFSLDFSVLAADIFDTLNEGIFITDTDFKIQMVNRYGLILSGYDNETLNQNDVEKLFEKTNYESIEKSFKEQLSLSKTATIDDIYMISKSNARVAINLSVARLEGAVPAYVFVVTDISKVKQFTYRDKKTNLELEAANTNYRDQQQAMLNLLEDSRILSEQLQQEKEGVEKKVAERTMEVRIERSRLQASINSLDIGFIIIDTNKKLLTANGAYRTIVNNSDDTIVPGLEHLALRLKDSFDIKEALDICFKNGENITKDNLQIDDKAIRIFIAPIFEEDNNAKSLGAVVLVEDITEAKAIERSRDEFFSIASHELRTPLTAIRGNTQMIKEYYKEQLSDPDLKDMVDDIHDSSIRLITIVNDFLDTSRLEQGKISFQLSDFEINDLVEEVAAEFKAGEVNPTLYIKIDKPETTLPLVHADRDRLKQTIINLVGNACKFTEKGGVTISMHQKDSYIFIDVTDTGKGIPAESRSLLFRKFQQASNNILTRDSTRSTGLGLYISKLIIEGMGGKIYMSHSELDKGSTFTIEIPALNKP